jgi:serine protease Do
MPEVRRRRGRPSDRLRILSALQNSPDGRLPHKTLRLMLALSEERYGLESLLLLHDGLAKKYRVRGGGLELTEKGRSERPHEVNISSGTGFFVSTTGHLLTNWHVVSNHSNIAVLRDKELHVSRLLAVDENNDLALLQTPLRPETGWFASLFGEGRVPRLRTSISVGEEIAVYGFPEPDILAPSFTRGIVTALAFGADNSLLQIQAPIHQGNSGGPVMDRSGNVVGVASSGITELALVNFAIKCEVVLDFLKANRVKPRQSRNGKNKVGWPTIAKRAKTFTVQIVAYDK